jgi:hypothetical protein
MVSTGALNEAFTKASSHRPKVPRLRKRVSPHRPKIPPKEPRSTEGRNGRRGSDLEGRRRRRVAAKELEKWVRTLLIVPLLASVRARIILIYFLVLPSVASPRLPRRSSSPSVYFTMTSRFQNNVLPASHVAPPKSSRRKLVRIVGKYYFTHKPRLFLHTLISRISPTPFKKLAGQ